MANILRFTNHDNIFYSQLSFKDITEQQLRYLGSYNYFELLFNKLKNKNIFIDENIMVFKETDNQDIVLIQLSLYSEKEGIKLHQLEGVHFDSLILTDHKGYVKSLILPILASDLDLYINTNNHSNVVRFEHLTKEHKFEQQKRLLTSFANDLLQYVDKCNIGDIDKISEVSKTLLSVSDDLK